MIDILMIGILPVFLKMNSISKKPKTVRLKVFSDDRGDLILLLDAIDKLNPRIGPVKRVYYVINPRREIIRGFHYHKREWKFFAIVNGSAKFVIVNPSNPLERYTFVTSERNASLIVVPPTYANGWVSLQDNTILVCVSNLSVQESLMDDKRIDPYEFGDVWTTKPR